MAAFAQFYLDLTVTDELITHQKEVLKNVPPDLWRMVQNAAKLPSEFVLDLDFEDIELVEKGSARPLIPVTALSTKWMLPFHL